MSPNGWLSSRSVRGSPSAFSAVLISSLANHPLYQLDLAQSGLYFAPPSANVQDLEAARTLLTDLSRFETDSCRIDFRARCLPLPAPR